jgi:hypothetical protein
VSQPEEKKPHDGKGNGFLGKVMGTLIWMTCLGLSLALRPHADVHFTFFLAFFFLLLILFVSEAITKRESLRGILVNLSLAPIIAGLMSFFVVYLMLPLLVVGYEHIGLIIDILFFIFAAIALWMYIAIKRSRGKSDQTIEGAPTPKEKV